MGTHGCFQTHPRTEEIDNQQGHQDHHPGCVFQPHVPVWRSLFPPSPGGAHWAEANLTGRQDHHGPVVQGVPLQGDQGMFTSWQSMSMT